MGGLLTRLFEPLELRSARFRNRVFVTPMCQYSSPDGQPHDWHFVHYGSRAVGGAALVIVEATAVSPEGRISPDDLGMWSDEQVEPWKRITAFVRAQGAVPGIQLAHAGRKASTEVPWRGGRPLAEGGRGWRPAGPSAEAFAPGHLVPRVALRSGDRRCRRPIRRGGAASATGRLRGGGDPHGPRVPSPPVSVSARESARRRLWRTPGKPASTCSGGGRRGAASLA